ncbi:uncharacterized protein [Phyllobates terribilis]|uniref:uncharacterized protein n=1 Tax=Phyllobates terribilis TaxID=111132 RepID=UPI003CCB0539
MLPVGAGLCSLSCDLLVSPERVTPTSRSPVSLVACMMTEQILDLTLEIVYLLTGEDYTVVKKSDRSVTSSSDDPQISREQSKNQSPVMKPPPPSLTIPGDNGQKIVEIINKILQVLTREVPVRCQDVTVHLSMEEWEYMEGHKDQYKDVLMEDPRPLTPPSGSSRSSSPESCQRPLDDHPENNEINDLVKLEETEGDEEYYRTNLPIKQEELETEVGTDDLLIPKCRPLASDCEVEDCTFQNTSEEHKEDVKNLPSDPTSLEGPSSGQSEIARNQGTEGRFSCFECEKHFTNNSFLKCLKCFVQKHALRTHERTHTGEKPYSCLECGKCFANKANLEEHQKVHMEDKPFSCFVCRKNFTRKADLLRHERIHSGEKPFTCSVCGKRFSNKPHLVEHERIHTGEKPFSCTDCGKCFRLRSTLNVHGRTHTGERPFSCSECERCFTQKSDLSAHQRSHTGEKPYACPYCGKRFTRKQSLVEHKRSHTGEKPYSCADCGKCFNQKQSLVVHQRIHSQEKPFSCSECGKGFNQKQALIMHQKNHSKENPYSCAECGQRFIKLQALIGHQRIHTADRPLSH